MRKPFESEVSHTWQRSRLRRASIALVLGGMFGLSGLLPAARAGTSASSSTDPRTLPRSSAPAPVPATVTATATRHGIRIMWQHAPANAASFNVQRSGGGGTSMLTSKAIQAHSFLDRTAQVGTAYTYSVAVASVQQSTKNAHIKSSGNLRGKAVAAAGQTIGSAEAQMTAGPSHSAAIRPRAARAHTPSLRQHPSAARAHHQRAGAAARVFAARTLGARVADPTHCAMAGALPLGATTWSSTACPGGYEVTADLTVPAGATLTLDPGVTVYVDTVSAPDNTGGTGDPSTGVDILVKGALQSLGTPTAPVTITSINSSPSDTSALPQPGDWGYLFFDGTNGNTPGGALTDTTIGYGTAVVADHYALPVSGATITDMAGDPNSDGLDITNVPTAASVSITGLSYDGTSTSPATGVGIYSGQDLLSATMPLGSVTEVPAAGFTASVSGSSITGDYPLWIEDDSPTAAGVNATVSGNTLSETGHGNELDLETWQVDSPNGYGSSPQVGTASLTGSVTGNTLTGGGSSYGALLLADATNTAGPTTTAAAARTAPACTGACNTVALSANGITSQYTAVDSESEVDTGVGNALTSNQAGDPSTGTPAGSVLSGDGEGVYTAAYNYGSGDATSTPAFTGATINGYDNGIDNYAESDAGNATATPSATGSSIVSQDYNGIYNQAYGSWDGGTGSATGSPSLTNTPVTAYDDAIYNDVEAGRGASTASPQVGGSKLVSSDDYTVENYSYADESSTDTPSPAVGNPSFSGSPLQSRYDDGLYNEVESGNGASTANPAFTGSPVSALDYYGIENYSYADWSSGAGDKATADPALAGSPVSSWDDAVYNDAESESGPSEANPSAVTSALTSVSEYGIENYSYAYGSTPAAGCTTNCAGSAVGSPALNGSTVQAYYEGLYNEVYSYGGAATASPTFTSSAVTSSDSDGVDNYSYSDDNGGSGDPAVADPQFSASPITSYDSGLYNEVGAENGGTAEANPSFTGSAVVATFDQGIYNEADSYGSGSSSLALPRVTTTSTPSAPKATADPTLSTSPVSVSGDGRDALDNYAYSQQGPSTADPSLTSSALTASDDYGIDNEAESSSNGGSGDALAKPSLTSSPVSAYDDGVYTYAYAGSGDSAADASPTLAASPVSTHNGAGLDAEAYSSGLSASTVSPTITGSDIAAPDSYGMEIYAEPNDSGAGIIGGSISGSTITSWDDGIYAEVYGGGLPAGATAGPVSGFTTALNAVALQVSSGDGIDAEGWNYGASIRMDPTITGGSINSLDDYAMELYGYGYGSVPTDVTEVAPVVSGTPATSYDGYYLSAESWSAGSGTVHAGGSFTQSPVQSLDGSGIDSESSCYSSCSQKALVDTAVVDSPVSAYYTGLYFGAYGPSGPVVDNASVGFSTPANVVQSYDDYGLDSEVYSDTATAQNNTTVKNAHISGYYGDIYEWASSSGGNAADGSTITGNTLDNAWSSSGNDGIEEGVSAAGVATSTANVSGNTVSGMQGSNGDGVYEYVGNTSASPASEQPQLTISKNTVQNVGGFGIVVDTHGLSPVGQCGTTDVATCVADPTKDVVHVTGNTVTRTGEGGISINGVLAEVAGNVQSAAGLAADNSTSGGRDGLFLANSTDRGLVSCNSVSSNVQGIEYAGNLTNATDPLTTSNAFTSPSGAGENQPYNLVTDNSSESPSGFTNAQGNFWGPYSPVASTIHGSVDSSSPLGAVPVCAGGAPPVSVGGGGGGGGTPPSPPTLPPGTTLVSTVTQQLPGGGSLSTGTGGATAANPVVASITLPGSLGGSVTIAQVSGAPPAPSTGTGTTTGSYSFLGLGFVITAPTSSDPSQPLNLGFSVLSSQLPAGSSPSDLVVFRDGAAVPSCSGAAPALPCSTVTVSGGAVSVSVLTDHASVWNFAIPKSTRLAGADREGTAVAVSQADFAAGKAGAVVLARSDDYPDALAGAALAVAKNAPVLLTSSSQLDPAVAMEMARALPKGGTVYLLGGEAALSSNVANAVQALGDNPVRVAGSDRYATAVAIAQAVGSVKTVLITTGTNFADALAAAPVTGTPGTVIVLTDGSAVPSATLTFLYAHTTAAMYAIGGPAAQAVPVVPALAGADRYATAEAVAAKFFASPAVVGVASGARFPDALAAGPHLARLGAPLLLTDPESLPASLARYLTGVHASLARAEVYGGSEAVSNAVQQAVTAAIG